MSKRSQAGSILAMLVSTLGLTAAALADFQTYRLSPAQYELIGANLKDVPAQCIDKDKRAAEPADRFAGAAGVVLKHTGPDGQIKTVPFDGPDGAIAAGIVEVTGTGSPYSIRIRLKDPPAGTWHVVASATGVVGETKELADEGAARIETPALKALYDRAAEALDVLALTFQDGDAVFDGFNVALTRAGWKVQEDGAKDAAAGRDAFEWSMTNRFGGGGVTWQEVALFLGRMSFLPAESDMLMWATGIAALEDIPTSTERIAVVRGDLGTLHLPAGKRLNLRRAQRAAAIRDALKDTDVLLFYPSAADPVAVNVLQMRTVGIAQMADVPIVRGWKDHINDRKNTDCRPRFVLALPKTEELASKMYPNANPADAVKFTNRLRELCPDGIHPDIASSEEQLLTILNGLKQQGLTPIVIAENLNNTIGFPGGAMPLTRVAQAGGHVLACSTFRAQGLTAVTTHDLGWSSIEAAIKEICGQDGLPNCSDFWSGAAKAIREESRRERRTITWLVAGAAGVAGTGVGIAIFSGNADDE